MWMRTYSINIVILTGLVIDDEVWRGSENQEQTNLNVNSLTVYGMLFLQGAFKLFNVKTYCPFPTYNILFDIFCDMLYKKQ